MSILISVVMSAYNAEKYIAESIESVLNQTESNFEFLITDDCSDDNTSLIIQSYKDERIVFYQNTERKGLTANLINMVSKAKGSFIARLDADDISAPERFKEQVEAFQNHNVEIVCSWGKAIGSRNGIIKTETDFEKLKAGFFFGNCIIHSSVMFRNNGHNYEIAYKKSQDIELWTRLLREGYRFFVIDKPLVSFRYHKGQISNNYSKDQIYYSSLARLRFIRSCGIYITDSEFDQIVQWQYAEQFSSFEQYTIVKNFLFDICDSKEKLNCYSVRAMRAIVAPMFYRICKETRTGNIKISNKEKMTLLVKSFSMTTLKVIIFNFVKNN